MNRAIVRVLLNAVLPAGVASVTAGAILADAPAVASWAAAVTFLVILWRQRGSLVPHSGTAAPRLVLALAGLVLYAEVMDGRLPDWPLVLAGVVTVGLLLGESLLHRIARPLYESANLPGEVRWPERLFNRRAVSAVNSALVAALLACVLLELPTWSFLALALAAAVATLGTVLTVARRRALGKEAMVQELRRRVTAYGPEFIVYFSGPAGSLYQMRMWLPHLERLDARFAMVLRERHAFPALAAAAAGPVIYTPEMETFDATVVPSLRAVFYVNNGSKNTHCVRYGRLTHVFLNHGDSDKSSSSNPVAAMYDRVFVAGRAGVDRYLNNGVDIPEHKFYVVGRPQVAAVEPPRRPLAQVTDPVVLFAPTWVGHYADANHSSLAIACTVIRAVLAHGATVILRHHPYTRRHRGSAGRLREAQRLLAADAEHTGRPHLWGAAAAEDLTLTECFNRSDALITDVSSVASEYLYSEKPFAITDMRREGEAFTQTFPLSRVAYVVQPDAANIEDVLHRLLATDPALAARLEAKVYYLGDFPRESYAEEFVAQARRCFEPSRQEQEELTRSRT